MCTTVYFCCTTTTITITFFFSMTKMNFKDLQFNLNKLTSNAKSQVAKKNPLQNHDTRALNLWLFEERNDLASIKTSAHHHAETNKAFLEWVKEEMVKNEKSEKYSQDIQDIGSTIFTLLNKQVELEREYTEKYQLYRRALKSMRDKEKQLSDLSEKKQTVADRIDHLKRSNPNSEKKLGELEKELHQVTITHDKEHEAAIDYKRFILKEAFYLRFNALSEYAEKSALIAAFGKYLVDLLDVDIQKDASSESRSDVILMDALLTIDGWQPADQRHTLTEADDLLSSLKNDDDATLLTDHDLLANRSKKKPVEQQQGGEEGEEFNEKASNNYYYQLYNHTQQHPKKALSSTTTTYRSYAEFQNQVNGPKDLPPAYTNENNVIASDTKNK